MPARRHKLKKGAEVPWPSARATVQSASAHSEPGVSPRLEERERSKHAQWC